MITISVLGVLFFFIFVIWGFAKSAFLMLLIDFFAFAFLFRYSGLQKSYQYRMRLDLNDRNHKIDMDDREYIKHKWRRGIICYSIGSERRYSGICGSLDGSNSL